MHIRVPVIQKRWNRVEVSIKESDVWQFYRIVGSFRIRNLSESQARYIIIWQNIEAKEKSLNIAWDGIIFTNENSEHATKWMSVKNYAELKKPNVKGYTIYNSIYIKCSKGKFMEIKGRSVVGWRWEQKLTENGKGETFGISRKVLKQVVVVDVQFYKFIKIVRLCPSKKDNVGE